jgi:hypothetical protein
MFDWLNQQQSAAAHQAAQPAGQAAPDPFAALATRLGISLDTLKSALSAVDAADGEDSADAPTSPAPLPPVLVAVDGLSHTLTPGDCVAGLGQLALRYGISFTALRDANLTELDAAARARGHTDSSNGYVLFPGTVIVLPGARARSQAVAQ